MAIVIDKKIVAYQVSSSPSQDTPNIDLQDDLQESYDVLHEKVVRPSTLNGCTYRIKTPVYDHAFFITINNIVMNPGTKYEHTSIFEIFINSKNMDNFQWITAITRVLSAVFRKGGDVAFIVDELNSIHDPKGGYFQGKKYVPSLVSAIGDVIKLHMQKFGIIPEDEVDPYVQKFINEKKQATAMAEKPSGTEQDMVNQDNATLCPKCLELSVISQGGCLVCLTCGDSKCS
jgi:hypothetical protein